mmetsp:Transcript_72290/g.182273  ORF Transcript_72290/g.182273 Transcript_72290/m.182273 type:complete len:289 (-) Transcript_72290:675-1541(-)
MTARLAPSSALRARRGTRNTSAQASPWNRTSTTGTELVNALACVTLIGLRPSKTCVANPLAKSLAQRTWCCPFGVYATKRCSAVTTNAEVALAKRRRTRSRWSAGCRTARSTQTSAEPGPSKMSPPASHNSEAVMGCRLVKRKNVVRVRKQCGETKLAGAEAMEISVTAALAIDCAYTWRPKRSDREAPAVPWRSEESTCCSARTRLCKSSADARAFCGAAVRLASRRLNDSASCSSLRSDERSVDSCNNCGGGGSSRIGCTAARCVPRGGWGLSLCCNASLGNSLRS